MSTSKWIHIAELGWSWPTPILTHINKAVDRKKSLKPSHSFYNLSLSIATRLRMLHQIMARISKNYGLLLDKLKNTKNIADYISCENKQGCALLIDDDLKYQLLADIDSFLFELNSCCELISKFLFQIFKCAGERIEEEKINVRIEEIIKKGGGEIDWFISLDKHRNFFAHAGAPYIAIDMTKAPRCYNLIIMKENLKKFDDSEKFIKLTELYDITHGFLHATALMQKYIIKYLDKL